MTDTRHTVVLRTPRCARTLPVMRVVLSGVASRHNIPLDHLDDLQLAVETLLADEAAEGEELILTLWTDANGLTIRLEGLTNEAMRSALGSSRPFEPCEGCPLDIRLFLDALVDHYTITGELDAPFAVEMHKRAL